MPALLTPLLVWAASAAHDDGAARREAALLRVNLAAVRRHQAELLERERELVARLGRLENPR